MIYIYICEIVFIFFLSPKQTKTSHRVGNRAWRWHDLLQLAINRFEHPYSALCLLGSQSSVWKSCYFQWGKILGDISMVNAINREVNILLQGLEIDCVFLLVFVQILRFGALCFAILPPHFFQMSFLRRYAIADFCKVWHSCVLPSPLPGLYTCAFCC